VAEDALWATCTDEITLLKGCRRFYQGSTQKIQEETVCSLKAVGEFAITL
jgi:hypothetical protein